jgi:hypothetical protein
MNSCKCNPKQNFRGLECLSLINYNCIELSPVGSVATFCSAFIRSEVEYAVSRWRRCCATQIVSCERSLSGLYKHSRCLDSRNILFYYPAGESI